MQIYEIATLQTSYLAIDECLKITNRRVNALEYIVIPKITYTIKEAKLWNINDFLWEDIIFI